jgi:hypothetical protein
MPWYSSSFGQWKKYHASFSFQKPTSLISPLSHPVIVFLAFGIIEMD